MSDHDQEKKPEENDPVSEVSEDVEKGQDYAEKLGKLVGRDVKPDPGVEMLTNGIAAKKDLDAADKAVSHDDYSTAAEKDLTAARSATSAIKSGAEILEAGEIDGAANVAAAASDANLVLLAAYGGFKGGNYVAKNVADSQEYARDKDGNARFGLRSPQDGGGARTRMDNVVDDARAGDAAFGGGWFGKAAAISNAAVSGVINGVESLGDATSTSPRTVHGHEAEAVQNVESSLMRKIDQDHDGQMLPAPTADQLGAAALRLQIENDPSLPMGQSVVAGSEPQYSGDTTEDRAIKKLSQQ